MPKVNINGTEHQVPEGITIIQACEIADIEIPRFCYHERLAIAGNCRMCLVEVAGGPPKPVASCAMPVTEGMQVLTDSPMVKKAREGVMEFLLANHPLDCPICDQGGECDLQDQAYQYGSGKSEYHEHKRAVVDKNMGPLIKTQMTRCIHCTRCVRFIEDVAGTTELGAVYRGENMQITTYLEKSVSSELSGNVIDLCPVGALTSKPYAFKARSWELKKTETIDIMDAVGSNIRIDSRGVDVMRILPRLNEEINEEWISDKARFCYDGLKYQRLDRPYVKSEGKLQPVTFEETYHSIVKKAEKLDPSEIAVLSGPTSSAEEVFALKELCKKLGITNFDCRLKGEKIDSSNRASYLFNTSIAGIDKADSCLIIGANPRKDAPILNARIRKRFLTKELKIAAIGCNADLTYDYQNLGNDVKILEEILNGTSDFSKVLENSKKPMLILGNDVVARQDGQKIISLAKKISEKFNLIQDDWNGFNFLPKSTGLVNGLEVGFTGTSNIEEIIEKAADGKIKMLILHSVDDEISFEKLEQCFVVYIGSHGDRGAHTASAILPSASFNEKNSIYVNLEGRPQEAKRANFTVGQAKEDLEIIFELAKKLKVDLGFKDAAELKQKLIENYPIFANMNSIAKADWAAVAEVVNDFSDDEIFCKDFDFYLTNSIARASRILNKCSNELN